MSNEKKFNLKEVFTMWLRESANGTVYLSGKSATGTNLVGFVNSKKEEPKQPDMDIYVQSEKGKDKEKYCSLWVNVSESGIKYISGKLEDQRLVGFFRDGYETGSKKPYFSVYISEDKPKEQPKAEVKPVSTKAPF